MCIAAVVSRIQNVGGRHRDRLLLSIEVNNRVNIQYATADFVMEPCYGLFQPTEQSFYEDLIDQVVYQEITYLIFQLHF